MPRAALAPKNAKEKQCKRAYFEEKLLAKYKISESFFLSGITHKIKF